MNRPKKLWLAATHMRRSTNNLNETQLHKWLEDSDLAVVVFVFVVVPDKQIIWKTMVVAAGSVGWDGGEVSHRHYDTVDPILLSVDWRCNCFLVHMQVVTFA